MALTETLVADRSERAKLCLRGPQRAWFAHQVLTQAFEDIAPGEARDAAMITAHGRMTGYLEVLATETSLLAHFEPELREPLPAEIRRYVFATQVEVVDVTDDMGLVLVAGPRHEELARACDGLVHPTSCVGAPAAYLWVDGRDAPAVVRALADAGARVASEGELERIRIAHGAPRWGREMGPKSLPQEAGIDAFAVDYDKGCYLGQEAMAKIHFRGRVNRSVRRLEAGAPLATGAEVTLDGAPVGSITSASDGRALAILRRTVEEGARVAAGTVEATVVD
jgi:folate-binding protein YgfZ